MSAHRMSLTEPFALSRVRESFADWFDTHDVEAMRATSFSFDAPELILVRGAGEMRPATAGAMAGALAGPAMVGVATALSAKAHHAVALPAMIGHAVTRGAAPAHWMAIVGWTVAVALGATIGSAFGVITRRMRAFAPMIAFGMVVASALWTVLHALALPRLAPWLAKLLPYGPMVIASAVFGAVLALEVPLRTRRLV